MFGTLGEEDEPQGFQRSAISEDNRSLAEPPCAAETENEAETEILVCNALVLA